MKFPGFTVPSLQELYSRPYDAKMIEWRRAGAKDKANNIIELLGHRTAEIETVLEVGVGTGDILALLAERKVGTSLFGVEIGDTRLDATSPHPNISFSYYDGARLDFPDAHFDLVYASHVLEHVVYERLFLHEMARVAKKLVYVEVPIEDHSRTSWQNLNTTLQIGHINAYSRHSFLLKLETSGLEVLEARLFDHNIDVYRFGSSAPKAALKRIVRRSALAAGIGMRMMTYHCGALCVPAPRLDIA